MKLFRAVVLVEGEDEQDISTALEAINDPNITSVEMIDEAGEDTEGEEDEDGEDTEGEP